MTRQIAEISVKENKIQYHITSLNPIRPMNKADDWESKALNLFEQGQNELTEFIEQEMVYKYMAPLKVKKACLKCHAKQGYKEGDIRGGISVTIPAGVYLDTGNRAKRELVFLHVIFFVVGIVGLFLFRRFRENQITVLNWKNDEMGKEIEHRKQVEEELIRAKTMAESANKSKSEFLANMSHELRTPFNTILGFSQLMATSSDITAEHSKHLDIIIRNGEHLLEMINQILDLSKIEAGKLELMKINFNFFSLLDDVIDIFKIRARSKQLVLMFDRTPDVPQYLHADNLKIRQVLTNLLGNAMKFTKEGSVSLRVSSTGSEELQVNDDARICFEIEDTGFGISKDEISNLFENFEQTRSGRESAEGTGLGLALSQNFIKLMGGEITIESTLDQGSIFKFEIDLKIADAAHVKEDKPSTRVVGLQPDQPVFRILVVDDKKDNRMLMVKMLSPLGFRVRTATNGKEAIEIWNEWEPDLIWMDMRMPVMNGYEATRKIKATDKGQATAVIALTASVFDEERSLVLSAGCNGFLRKPFRPSDLFDLMAKHLGVKYILKEVAQKPDETGSESEVVSPETLTELPGNNISNLRDALERSDMEKIGQTITAIRSLNPQLAEKLADLADNFEYETLLELIEKAQKL